MDRRKIVKALLFPPIAIMIILLPVAAVLLVYSMVFIGTESVFAMISYALAAYTLTIWCMRIPCLIRFFKTFRDENKYARRWLDDTRLRVTVSLYGSMIWNTAYAVLQLGLGFWHHSFWFCSLAGYYISLAVMRFFLVKHTGKHKPGEKMREELIKYRACGIVFFCYEPGTFLDDILYGVLEQNLSSSQNHNNFNGCVLIYFPCACHCKHCKVSQIQQSRILRIQGHQPCGSVCVDAHIGINDVDDIQ